MQSGGGARGLELRTSGLGQHALALLVFVCAYISGKICVRSGLSLGFFSLQVDC